MRFWPAVAILVLVTIAAACGDDDGGDVTPTATPTRSPTPAATTAPPTAEPTDTATATPSDATASPTGAAGDCPLFPNDQMAAMLGEEITSVTIERNLCRFNVASGTLSLLINTLGEEGKRIFANSMESIGGVLIDGPGELDYWIPAFKQLNSLEGFTQVVVTVQLNKDEATSQQLALAIAEAYLNSRT